jgi:ribosome-binding factor A
MRTKGNSGTTSPRALRVGQLVQEELSRLLLRGLKDPRLTGFITLTGVKLSPDLREGTVYFSVFGEAAERERTSEGLKAAAPYLQREVSRALRLRNTPHLRFTFDESIERGDRIDRLLRGVKDEPDQT